MATFVPIFHIGHHFKRSTALLVQILRISVLIFVILPLILTKWVNFWLFTQRNALNFCRIGRI
ncbi:MAG: hypothetical protein CBC48_02410 [bacterium TMED88]|nr:MAG: hypothetical protein CBC48_02410 [bacterium TMED88]